MKLPNQIITVTDALVDMRNFFSQFLEKYDYLTPTTCSELNHGIYILMGSYRISKSKYADPKIFNFTFLVLILHN